MLDKAFESLASYDWGVDPKVLSPIDEAIVETHGDEAARQRLEERLAAVLTSDAPRAAKDYVCRQLRTIGTESSVPTLANLLPDEQLSHMSRYALERIPAPAAGDALRDALPQLTPPLNIGVISSLGVRQDAASVPELANLLESADQSVASAAAFALGAIRNPQAARALASAQPAGEAARRAATDASLACGEALLADGQKAAALAIYKQLADAHQPKLVRLAATRGMLACAGKQQ